ncbi:MAG: DEAD/DEAH box helicase [Nannocystaceae bacterium]|nr:DEAD/DEAH box helicase family protein [bacterium]
MTEELSELLSMRVVDIRDYDDDKMSAIGDLVGRTPRWVKRTLADAHGSTRLSTLFEHLLPEFEDEEEQEENDYEASCPLEGETPEETSENILDALRGWSDKEIRAFNFPFPQLEKDDIQPLMNHQAEALARVEKNGFASGIIHLPTGAGKTRTALELMARLWEQDERTLFIWASHGKNLVRQSMIRLAEMLPRFNRALYVAWLEASDPERYPDLFHDANALFATRDTLTKLLERSATSRRKEEPLRDLLTSKSSKVARPVVVIYDECHEMGAAGLQKAWREFHDKLLSKHKRASQRFRAFGLSATPLPTAVRSHKLLQDIVFPIQPQTKTEKEWGLLVHASASMADLTSRRMLCPMNLGIQESGRFDIPDQLLEDVLQDEMPRPPSRSGLSERQWVNEFSKRFNRDVMSDPRILKFLADQIARDFETLGKTIVFSATINAAQQLVAYLRRHKKIPKGAVSLVHSHLEDLEVVDFEEDDQSAKPHELETQTQIETFKNRGNNPCIMVNVGMLTTGFDDPKIRTILLARLTFSKNLFWQMIGRGLRGPAANGTQDCHVIDPIRLTEKFEVFNGYRPNLSSGGIPENDLHKTSDLLSDSDLAPVIEDGAPQVPADPQMERLAKDVRAALKEFLHGEAFDAKRVAEILSSEVQLEYGPEGHVFRPATEEDAPRSFRATLERRIQLAEEKLGADLAWFYQDVPQVLDDTNTEYTLRKLQAVEKHRLLTETDMRKFEMARWG